MYRKLTMLALVASGCSTNAPDGPRIAVSALAATDLESAQNEYVGRVGLEQELVTAGVQTHFIGTHGEQQFLGGYAVTSLPNMDLLGTPYVGYQVGIPIDDGDMGYHGPIMGTRHEIAEGFEMVTEIAEGFEMVTEGWYRSFNGELKNADFADEWKLLVGPRIRF
jgi:hypothetical protein